MSNAAAASTTTHGDAGVKPDLRNPPPCMTLGCKVAFCKGSHPTTLTGTVYIPAGGLPLPNAYVYVPGSTVDPIPEGVSCNRCDAPLSGARLPRRPPTPLVRSGWRTSPTATSRS